jgi:protein TonB
VPGENTRADRRRAIAPRTTAAPAGTVEVFDEPAAVEVFDQPADPPVIAGVVPASALRPPLPQTVASGAILVGRVEPSSAITPSLATSAAASATPGSASHFESAVLLDRVLPVYPTAVGNQVMEGTVQLSAIIGRDGSPRQVEIVSGEPALAESALAAVAQWRYRPASLGGRPVEVSRVITVHFRPN